MRHPERFEAPNAEVEEAVEASTEVIQQDEHP
jgi:hypothetical protein